MAIEYYKKALAYVYIPDQRAQALTNLAKAYRELATTPAPISAWPSSMRRGRA